MTEVRGSQTVAGVPSMRAPVPGSQVVRRAAWHSVRTAVQPTRALDRSPQHGVPIVGTRGLDVVGDLRRVPAADGVGVAREVLTAARLPLWTSRRSRARRMPCGCGGDGWWSSTRGVSIPIIWERRGNQSVWGVGGHTRISGRKMHDSGSLLVSPREHVWARIQLSRSVAQRGSFFSMRFSFSCPPGQHGEERDSYIP